MSSITSASLKAFNQQIGNKLESEADVFNYIRFTFEFITYLLIKRFKCCIGCFASIKASDLIIFWSISWNARCLIRFSLMATHTTRFIIFVLFVLLAFLTLDI